MDRLATLTACDWAMDANQLVIDGPCKTNGIPLSVPANAWDFANATPGVRAAERELARRGIGLFWTSMATLQNFHGASRWIARAVRLFGLPPVAGRSHCIETHPHAVFTMLQRALLGSRLQKKCSPAGRQQRLCLLKYFIPNLDSRLLPTHDHIDSAAAALMGALRQCGRAEAVGDAAGGYIWVPRL